MILWNAPNNFKVVECQIKVDKEDLRRTQLEKEIMGASSTVLSLLFVHAQKSAKQHLQ